MLTPLNEKAPCWARGPWKRTILHHRICELMDAECRCAVAGVRWSGAAAGKIKLLRDEAILRFLRIEIDELDMCERACVQAEIEITKIWARHRDRNH
jgi:hypothetical protein